MYFLQWFWSVQTLRNSDLPLPGCIICIDLFESEVLREGPRSLYVARCKRTTPFPIV